MITINDLVMFPLDEGILKETLSMTIERIDISHLNNLRYRTPAVQLDCLFRGYLGEVCLRRWFARYCIYMQESNMLDTYTNMDIDMRYVSPNTHRQYAIEVKTSNIPDVDRDLQGVLNKRDIKLIKRTSQIEYLSGDIHVQIYYDFLRAQRDAKLNSSRLTSYTDIDYLYRALHLEDYIGRAYLVGWIDKPTLIHQINALPFYSRTWTWPNSQKYFWVCKFNSMAKTPTSLIQYLANL